MHAKKKKKKFHATKKTKLQIKTKAHRQTENKLDILSNSVAQRQTLAEEALKKTYKNLCQNDLFVLPLLGYEKFFSKSI